MSTGVSESTVIAELGQLRAAAPAAVLPNVLVATGLADEYASVEGPTGDLYVAWNETGVSAVAPAADDEGFEAVYADRVGRPLVPGEMPEKLSVAVSRAFATGKPGRLTVDLSTLTPFQQDVLRVTATIPKGEIRTYGWVAREVGHPGAARAVGSALNRNPVPVLVPCHRVGRSDGTLGEYAFGTSMKRDLLEAEGVDTAAADDLVERGTRYVGSDTTHIFCFPTCRNARRITDAHRVEFRSAGAAEKHGYRACKVCRPAVAA
jgi:O-6-methylguanine DNA methyltransferase